MKIVDLWSCKHYPYLIFILRVFVGGYFLYAAIPKIAEPLAFATSIHHYEMMPAWSVNAYALVVPWLEVIVGVGLVAGLKTRTSAIITGVMLVMFTIAVAWAVMNGLEIDCGCFGEQGGDQVSWLKVLKNTGMILACVLIAWKPTSWLALDGLGSRSQEQ